KRRVSGDIATLRLENGPQAARDLLAGHPAVREVTVDGPSIRLSVDHGEQALPGLLRVLDDAGLRLASIQLARPTLDDVFLTLTGRSLRDDSQQAPAPGPEHEAGLAPAAR
ncbi:MAG TPA: DUF4162 domain-containing protein, partial [Streptosporangiaceae bacterium]